MRQTLEQYREGIFIPMQVYVMEHLGGPDIEDVLASGTRIIGQYHSSYAAARATRDHARLSRTYRQLDKFLLLTAEDARRFQQDNFNNTGSMPNPLSLFPREWRTTRENLLVSIARYDRNKSLDHPLRAWAMVPDVQRAFREPIETAGRSIGDAALQVMVDGTSGYPFLLHLVGAQTWRLHPAATEITVEDETARRRRRLRQPVPATPDRGRADLPDARRGYVDFALPYLREYLRGHAAADA